MMKTNIQEKIAYYKFQDSHRQLYATILGNFLFVFGFIISSPNTVLNNPFAYFSLFTALILWGIHQIYNWKTTSLNWLILSIYLVVFISEVFFFGVPPALIGLSPRVSKGVLLELFTALIPFLYTGLRLILIIFIIQLIFRSQQLKEINKLEFH